MGPEDAGPKYLGIDPGALGALVVLGGNKEVLDFLCSPYTDNQLSNWLRQHKSLNEWVPYTSGIERIKPTYGPGASKTSAAKLYGSYTSLKMALECWGFKYQEVESQDVWYYLGIGTRKKKETTYRWKGRHKEKAQELFPTIKVTSVTCDALLIAEYLRRRTLGILIADPETEENTNREQFFKREDYL